MVGWVRERVREAGIGASKAEEGLKKGRRKAAERGIEKKAELGHTARLT